MAHGNLSERLFHRLHDRECNGQGSFFEEKMLAEKLNRVEDAARAVLARKGKLTVGREIWAALEDALMGKE